jgi:hypothetical protein
MEWRHVVVVIGLALSSASAAAEVAIQDFNGSWRGVEVRTSGDDKGLAITPEDLDVQIRGADGGFHMSWTGFARQADGELKRRTVEASFTPTDRPGVYAFDPGQSSLLSRLFADPATGNPLVRLVEEEDELGSVHVADLREILEELREEVEEEARVESRLQHQLVGRQDVDHAAPAQVGPHEVGQLQCRLAEQGLTPRAIQGEQRALHE